MAYKINDKCNGCDDCTQLCPVRAISGDMKELHIVDPNRCIDCGACAHICEYEAVLDETGKVCKYIPREQWKKPVIDEKACDGCGICVEECPVRCLTLEPTAENKAYSVSVLTDAETCHGCGVCQRHCPIEAITLK